MSLLDMLGIDPKLIERIATDALPVLERLVSALNAHTDALNKHTEALRDNEKR